MPMVIHFLNVGRGDCTIIEFPSANIGVVDIDVLKSYDPSTRDELLQEYRLGQLGQNLGGALLGGGLAGIAQEATYLQQQREKLTDPILYYDTHIGKQKSVFRFIITHPDMDHMTGLNRFVNVEKRPILNFWHSGNNDFNLASTTKEEWDNSPYEKEDWQTYKQLRASSKDPKSLQNYRGDTGNYWTQDGIEILSPTKELETLAVEKQQANILSMVLRLSYKGRSVVIGGDATAEESWPDIYQSIDLTGVDVLKASHHGRKSGYHRESVKAMSPWLTITSVGDRNHDATDSYRRYSDYTVSLRKSGDIRITIQDDGKLLYSANIEEVWKEKIKS
jgi:competence protein ComEC